MARDDGAGDRWVRSLPGMLSGWTNVRDLHAMPKQTFREWWEERQKNGGRSAKEGP
jgi:L-lactate dehydrogenase complex protein LldF